jgi:hypothetical protein
VLALPIPCLFIVSEKSDSWSSFFYNKCIYKCSVVRPLGDKLFSTTVLDSSCIVLGCVCVEERILDSELRPPIKELMGVSRESPPSRQQSMTYNLAHTPLYPTTTPYHNLITYNSFENRLKEPHEVPSLTLPSPCHLLPLFDGWLLAVEVNLRDLVILGLALLACVCAEEQRNSPQRLLKVRRGSPHTYTIHSFSHSISVQPTYALRSPHSFLRSDRLCVVCKTIHLAENHKAELGFHYQLKKKQNV